MTENPQTWAETMRPGSTGDVMVQMSKRFKGRYRNGYISEVELFNITQDEDQSRFTRELAAYVYVMSKEHNWRR